MIAGITEKEQKIIERILDKYRKDYAFFYYGSRVKGTYGKTSDLDVLIKGKAEMPLAVLQEIKEEFDKSDLPYIVNFSDYYKLDSSFYERIKPDIIPYKWQEVKLGDVCRFQNGYAFKSAQFTNNGNIKIIKIKEIKDGKIIFFDDSASVYYDDKYKKYQVQNDDILVALTGDPVARPNPASWVGRIAIFRGSEKALINQRVAKFLPNKTVLFPQFIYYFFRDFSNFYNLAKKATGSASQANISTDMLENTEILLPPLEVQKKIAGVLGALDDKIELNNNINQNLEAQAQALFKSWFVDFEPFGGKMPDDWKIGKVEDIIDLYDSQRIPLSSNQRANIKKVYPYYGATSVMDFVDNYIFDGKYLLLGEDGTVIDDKGFPILQYVWGKFWVNNHAHIMTGKNGFNVESLYLFFKQTNVKRIVTGAVQPKINQANLKMLPVNIPSNAVMNNFNKTIEPLFSLFRTNTEENKRLIELRDTLLPKLMSGEINVNDGKILADKSSFTGEI